MVRIGVRGGRSIQEHQSLAIDPARLSVGQRLSLAAIGATPVTLIGFATFGILTLKQLTVAVLIPAFAGLVALLTASSRVRSLVAAAVIAGLFATFVYDLLRWTFLVADWMDQDPIPHIGTSLGLEPGWLFGYGWRFFGNGGGLAIVFFVSGCRGVLAGAAFGLVVCSGLIGVLLFAPYGQATLFPLEPATWVVAVAGHLIYGGVLGSMSRLVLQPPE